MILTTGIQNAPVVSRLELRTFLQDKDVTNLYVLATDQMMRIPQDDLSSWFQMAAIHGRPYIPYDGVGVKGSFGGYCTHSSILFPSWHRPYLALFEQSLSKHVHEIAAEYKNPADKERYLKAAKRFRIPYWDWATDPALPDIVATEEMIDVHLPDGTKGNIRNPLFGYYFNPVYSDFGDGLPDEKIWEAWQATYRYPTTTDSKAKSVPTLMQSTLRNNRLTLHDRTYNILTQLTDYVVFSHDASTGNDQDPAGFDSIESIHNQIHGLAGRNGHMGVVDYAAFDPVFWMHHANVDRLFAIWQGLNPDAYVTPLKSEAGTFTRKPGEIENVESPLTPFRRTAEKFWNSVDVRNTHVFNYTYPELEGLDTLSKEEKIIRLRQAVNRLYAPTHSAPKPVPTLPTGTTPAGGAHPTPAAPEAHKPTEHGHAPAPEAHKPTEHGYAPAPEAHKPTEHGHAPTQHGHETAQHGHAPTHHERATAQHGRAPAQHGRAPTQHGHDIIGHALGATQLAHEIISTANDGAQAIIATTNPAHVRIATATNPAHVLASTAKDNVDEHHHEWIANIAVEKYAVKSSFFVHLFLGDVDDDHTKWGTHPNLVGSHVIFANNANFTGCEKCRDAHEKKKVVTGTIPLTRSLVARLGGIQHLHPEKVAPFLQKNLHWRVQKHDNTPIDVKQLPSLKVSVGHSIVQIAKIAEHFASWNGIQLHDSVTSGRPGGA